MSDDRTGPVLAYQEEERLAFSPSVCLPIVSLPLVSSLPFLPFLFMFKMVTHDGGSIQEVKQQGSKSSFPSWPQPVPCVTFLGRETVMWCLPVASSVASTLGTGRPLLCKWSELYITYLPCAAESQISAKWKVWEGGREGGLTLIHSSASL